MKKVWTQFGLVTFSVAQRMCSLLTAVIVDLAMLYVATIKMWLSPVLNVSYTGNLLSVTGEVYTPLDLGSWLL